MNEIDILLDEMINEGLLRIILSNPKDKEQGSKVMVRPVLIKDKLLFQQTIYRGTQVFHENLNTSQIKEKLHLYLESAYRQAEFSTQTASATVLISKKGKITIKKKILQEKEAVPQKKDLRHDRSKHYILEEGRPVDFLIGLGVQTPEGKIVKAKYDKFRQINRYLEFIEDVLSQLPTDRTVRIIDFGCGKSYLTFAMYYYLHELKGYDIKVTGLDLKEDVIRLCSRLAAEYGYEGLTFEKGDISTYEGEDKVDMVVSLHACDTATDHALEKAVRWKASVILAVPCCQHEVNKQLSCAELAPLLGYGVIKERVAALFTDAIRAQVLEEWGYDVQILEFIDMEHTPKNLLIRAVKRKGLSPRRGDIGKTTDLLHVETTLQKLLKEGSLA